MDHAPTSSQPQPQFDPFGGPQILAVAPSTEPQREIWIATRIGEEASLAFNESVSLRLEGRLDLHVLKLALDEVYGRHEALHSTFSGDGLSLVVVSPAPLEVPVFDWSAEDESKRAGLLAGLLDDEVRQPFDLEKGPLFRARIARLAADRSVLVLTAHHIVCDGWSTAVVVKDLAAVYSARLGGREPELAPAEAFSAYAQGQAVADVSPERNADREYWRNRFLGDVPVLDLPTDRPRPPLRSHRADRLDVALDAELLSSMRKVGAKQGASLFTSLLAVFHVLLHRLSGQGDVVVGIPAAGQAVGGHDLLVGHCVNTLPIRCAMDPSQPFSEFLRVARSAMLDAFDHQELTFGALLKELPITRDASRMPLVSVVFNVDRGLDSDSLPFDPPTLVASLATNKRRFENFEVFVNAVELGGAMTLEVQFNTDLFDRATIARWMALYELMARAAAKDPSLPIGRLPALSEADREQLALWNRCDAPIPSDPRVHRLIEEQANRTPDAVAIESEQGTLTYRELDRRANRLARRLRARGVRRGVLVGLCLDRSAHLMVGLLAVMKAGGAYVPLDPGYPIERLSYMAEDSGLTVLVSERSVLSELPLEVAHTEYVDDDSLSDESSDPLPPGEEDAAPSSPCYVIYTSGSTGKPKGVLVPHRSVVNLLTSVRQTPGMTAKDVVLAITTLSFDIAVSEVILPLTVGARIVLVTREVAADGVRLLDAVRERHVTFIDATPATWRLLLSAGWEGTAGLTAICTGEAMPRDLAISLTERAARVWNGYGPTETTVWSTFYEVPKNVARVLIGRPVANTTLHVLGPNLEPVPLGANGELFIGGEGVTLGYHNRPDLTAERFLPDPFQEGSRMYRTGDIVRFLPDGNLECLGRNDNQVKLRGFRIELGEIEDALGQHGSVRQAAVIVREDRPGDKRLVGYVVFEGNQPDPTDSALRAHLKATLPDYMVPSAFVRLPTMPLTPSGKIDRKSLPAPVAGEGAASDEFVAPSTPSEELLAKLWKEVLGLGRVGVTDDFFALGGHSLLASQILARLRSEHGIVLSFRSMFEAPTIAAFARLVDAAKSGGEKPVDVAPIPRRDGSKPARASLSQERLWLLEEMDPAQQIVHNLAAAWRLQGPIDFTLLERALDAVAERHESLRTTFSARGGTLEQVIARSIRVAMPIVDLRDRPEEERPEALEALFTEHSRRPFDLTTGPLFRAVLVRLTDDEQVLFTLRHNIIWDGWSFDVFLSDVAAFYAAFTGDAVAPAPLPITYADFAEWHRGWLDGPEMGTQVAFWKKQLGGDLPVLELPTDRPRQAKQTHAGANERFFVARPFVDSLNAVARESGATLFMVLLAAFDTMLHRYTGEADVLVGTPVRARTRPETENLIGVFVNNVILRVRMQPERPFRDLLMQVRDITLDAFSHQEMPLELLPGKPPVIRALFSLQDARNRPRDIGPASVSQVHVHAPAASNDMMLWGMETQGGLLVVLNFNTDLFDPETIQRFLRQYETLLGAIAKDANRALATLPILPDDEQRALAEFGRRKAGAGATADASAVLSRLAETAPSAVAVGGAKPLSYVDLREKSHRLARRLRAAGAAPGAVVAVLLDDPADRVVAFLGAVEVGATCLVCDPAEPVARTLGAVRDSGALVVVRGTSEPPAEGEARVLGLHAEDDGPLPEDNGASLASEAARAALLLGVPDPDGRTSLVNVGLANLRATALDLAAALELSSQSVVVVATEPSTGVSAAAVFAALSTGATIVLATTAARRDVAELSRVVEEAGATVLIAPRGVFADLSRGGFAPKASFRAVCYGRPIASSVARDLIAAGARVSNVYGTDSTGVLWAAGEVLAEHGGNRIGAPLPHTGLRVVNRSGAPSPIGVPGELEVAEGDAFRPTGDTVRWSKDGTLEWLARSDHRTWIGGQLVDAREVSAALAAHHAIERAVVTAREADGNTRLVAYYVARAGESFTETELRNALRLTLAPAMMPSAYVELDELPTAPGGGVDLTKLPPPADEVPDGPSFVPPRTDAERLLATLFAEALDVPQVSVLDNFFDLGGYSLLCFQVLGKIEERTGKRLSPRLLLLNTLEQVAAQIELKPATQAPPPVARYVPPPEPKGLLGRLRRIVKGS